MRRLLKVLSPVLACRWLGHAPPQVFAFYTDEAKASAFYDCPCCLQAAPAPSSLTGKAPKPTPDQIEEARLAANRIQARIVRNGSPGRLIIRRPEEA